MYYPCAALGGLEIQKKSLNFSIHDVYDTARFRVLDVVKNDFSSQILKNMVSKPFFIDWTFNVDSKYVLPKCGP